MTSTHRRLAVIAASVAALVLHPSPAGAQTAMPELPRVFVDTSFKLPTNIVTVPLGGNLQAAINAAQPGTMISVPAGAVFGAISLPNKSGQDWICIVSTGTLPALGNRVGPANAGQMAKIQVSTVGAITTAGGAHHYRFVGIEVSVTGTLTGAVVDLSASSQPHHIIFDRCYIHGTANGTQRRGVTMHGAHLAVIDSYVADFKENGADSQAIVSWDGTGPLKIVNNYLSAAGENVMFGGADPTKGTIGPSDVEVRGNYFYKPPAWKTTNWTVKNLLELKNCRRCLIEGNVLEHSWPSGQNGTALVLTPRNQDGSCPGCGTQDITYGYNIIIDGYKGIGISGEDDDFTSTRTARVLLHDNDFQVTGPGYDGWCFQMVHGAQDVTFNHNTFAKCGNLGFMENVPKSTGFVFTNNISPVGVDGLLGTGSPNPASTLTVHYVSPVWTANAMVGGLSSAGYPAGNFYPSSVAAATQIGNDGRPVGANRVLLAAATACTVSGQCGNAPPPPPPPPPPSDTTPPSIAFMLPTNGATFEQGRSVALSASVSDDSGSVAPVFKVGGQIVSSPYTFTAIGPLTIVATATDPTGNTGTASVTVNVVAAPPPPPPPPPPPTATLPAGDYVVADGTLAPDLPLKAGTGLEHDGPCICALKLVTSAHTWEWRFGWTVASLYVDGVKQTITSTQSTVEKGTTYRLEWTGTSVVFKRGTSIVKTIADITGPVKAISTGTLPVRVK